MFVWLFFFGVILLDVGKSALLARFSQDTFEPESHATIGVEFQVRTVQSKAQPDRFVKLQIVRFAYALLSSPPFLLPPSLPP